MFTLIFRTYITYRLLPILLLSLYLLGCNGHDTLKSNLYLDRSIHNVNPFVYFLSFDHNGIFTSHHELNRAIDDLSQNENGRKVHKILILSLGWGHNRDELFHEYEQMYANYKWWEEKNHRRCNDDMKNSEDIKCKGNIAVFFVLWESSLSSLGDAITDISPGEDLLLMLSYPLQPLTYWAKAGLADKIGSQDLKEVIYELESGVQNAKHEIQDKYCNMSNKTDNTICKSYNNQPFDKYFVAHSFGSRIVTNLLNNNPNLLKDCNSNINEIDNNTVKGVLLIQPALSSYEIYKTNIRSDKNLSTIGNRDIDKPKYPLLVTESRHDHLNRLLFPLVNIPLNSAYNRETNEALLSKNIDDLCVLPCTNSNINDIKDTLSYYSKPFDIVRSSILFALTYPVGQAYELSQRGWRYIPDTLAQLPIVEIPVESINAKFIDPERSDDENYWGHRHKGLFYFGPFFESAATTITENPKLTTLSIQANAPIGKKTSKTINAPFTQAKILELPTLPNGVTPIDMSEEINQGAYGEYLSSSFPIADWTLGWFDPLGSHTDVRKPEIYELIYKLLNNCTPVPACEYE